MPSTRPPPRSDSAIDPTLRLIRRYEATAQRERRKAMDELRRLQQRSSLPEPQGIDARPGLDLLLASLGPPTRPEPIEEAGPPPGDPPSLKPEAIALEPTDATMLFVDAETPSPEAEGPAETTTSFQTTRRPTLSDLHPAGPRLNRRARRAMARKAAHRS